MSRMTNLSGRNGEDIVARELVRRGLVERARRWRGSAGEIDLIFADADGLIFIEVKTSRNHGLALRRLSAAQAARIMGTATEYLAHIGAPMNTNMRFDVATVDGQGMVQILENALSE